MFNGKLTGEDLTLYIREKKVAELPQFVLISANHCTYFHKHDTNIFFVRMIITMCLLIPVLGTKFCQPCSTINEKVHQYFLSLVCAILLSFPLSCKV